MSGHRLPITTATCSECPAPASWWWVEPIDDSPLFTQVTAALCDMHVLAREMAQMFKTEEEPTMVRDDDDVWP